MVPVCLLTCRQLSANLAAVENLEQLQLLINRHAHQMNMALLSKAIQKTPQVRPALWLLPSGSS